MNKKLENMDLLERFNYLNETQYTDELDYIVAPAKPVSIGGSLKLEIIEELTLMSDDKYKITFSVEPNKIIIESIQNILTQKHVINGTQIDCTDIALYKTLSDKVRKYCMGYGLFSRVYPRPHELITTEMEDKQLVKRMRRVVASFTKVNLTNIKNTVTVTVTVLGENNEILKVIQEFKDYFHTEELEGEKTLKDNILDYVSLSETGKLPMHTKYNYKDEILDIFIDKDNPYDLNIYVKLQGENNIYIDTIPIDYGLMLDVTKLKYVPVN